MQFRVEFDCDNASFGDRKPEQANEIMRVLMDIGTRVCNGTLEAAVHDSNGNRIGRYWLAQHMPAAEK